MASSAQVKRLVDIVWRRKWWAVVPTVLTVVASLVLVAVGPKAYRATTTILVTRQRVPEDIVRSTVTLRVEERMRSLQVQLFSRSYLEQIAREFELMPANAREAEIEGSLMALRAQIFLELDGRDFSWFRIAVENADPKRAAGIANRLADLFIEQNSRMRASQAAGTLEATEGWEEKYGLELAKRDKEIAAFKQRNIYELPDRQPANLQLLNSSQTRVTQLTSEFLARNDRLVALRTQQLAQRAIGAASGARDSAGDADAPLARMGRELAELLVSYTDENPLVRRKREQIADLVRTLPPVVAGDPGAATAARLDPTSLQIVAIQNEINGLERDRAQESANLAVYRARIGNAPQHQQKLLDLTRDYDTLKREFDTAVVQKEQARRAKDLEESMQGEQFQVQDRAHPPAVPDRPDFVQYLIAGIVFGLALGAGTTAAREAVDQAVRSEEEFSTLFPDLPVYGVIPSLDIGPESRFGAYATARGAAPRIASALVPLLVALLAGLTVLIASLA